MRALGLLAALSLAAALPCVTPAFAAVRYVNGDRPISGTGTSWQTAFRTIAEAVAVATPTDEIWVARGRYAPPALGKAVRLYGGFSGLETSRTLRRWRQNPTVLDARGLARVLVISHDGTILDGFHIRGGATGGPGGGVLLSGAMPGTRVENCLLYENSAQTGGAMALDAATGTVRNCGIFRNSAQRGGAIHTTGGATAALINCTLYGNRATEGGGATRDDPSSHATYQNCILWGNTSATGPQTADTDGSHAIYSYCAIPENIGYATLREDPRLVNPFGGDLRLRPDSPMIDAGTNLVTDPQGNFALPPTDMDGDPRPTDGNDNGFKTADIGADEYMPGTRFDMPGGALWLLWR